MSALEVESAHGFVTAETTFSMTALIEDSFLFVAAHGADEAEFREAFGGFWVFGLPVSEIMHCCEKGREVLGYVYARRKDGLTI